MSLRRMNRFSLSTASLALIAADFVLGQGEADQEADDGSGR